MSISSPTFDLVVRSRNGELVAIAEIKNQERLTKNTAKAIRQNLLVHGMPQHVMFFLLMSEDELFLWKDSAKQDFDSEPTLQVDMKPVVSRYSKGLDRSRRLRGTELELLIQQWLIDLSEGRKIRLSKAEKALEEAGFVSAVYGGQVSAESSL